MKKSILITYIISALLFSLPTHTYACTDLRLDLGTGSTDTNTGGNHVTLLQNHLRQLGYLTATPNGVFGPATREAVKKLQATGGLSQTGFVGPLTRSYIKNTSCYGPQTTQTTSQTSTQTISITSPRENATLTIDKEETIRWKTAMKSTYSIILEDSKGVSMGYIAPALLGNTSYVWKVGSVYSTEIQDNRTVDPGTYRIRIRNTYSGDGTDDPMSAFFTIQSQPIYGQLVYPKTVNVSKDQSIVLYGSGFNDKTTIYIDGAYNIRTTKLYTSPDGRVIIFQAPKTLSPGSHSLWAYNGTEVTNLNLNFESI